MTSNITFSFVLVPVILLTKKYHVTTAAPGQAYDPKCFLQSCLVTVAEIPSPCCKANKAPCCYLWERLLGTLLWWGGRVCESERLREPGGIFSIGNTWWPGCVAFLWDYKLLLPPCAIKQTFESCFQSAGRWTALLWVPCWVEPCERFRLWTLQMLIAAWAGLCLHK